MTGNLAEGWDVHIFGPDGEGLIWISLSHPQEGAAAFSAPATGVRGSILSRARKSTTWKIGDRAKFVGHDTVFHDGERQGKTGTIVTDADLGQSNDFGGGTCGWRADGSDGVYITALADLDRCK